MAKIKPWEEIAEKYVIDRKLPTSACAGCGTGTTGGAILRAIDETDIPMGKIVFVTGIGCYGTISNYLNFDGMHLAHGRAPAVATALKVVRPDLTVICIQGDGDISAIGGNHFIHAARRNVDITIIVLNNHIYGMTGGQYSPTTRTGDFTNTTPWGMIEPAFDLCALAETAGGTYVARGCTYRAAQLIDLIRGGLEHKGFSLIEVENQCPVIDGRLNHRGSAVDMLKQQAATTVTVERAKTMTPEQLKGKITTGVLVNKEAPEYSSEYRRIIEQARAEKGSRNA